MSLDKKKLEDLLNEQPILLDEKRMWFTLGFYIFSHPTTTDRDGYKQTVIVDACGNQHSLNAVSSKNIRMTILEWWEGEKKKGQQQKAAQEAQQTKKIEVGPYDDLEARNNTS